MSANTKVSSSQPQDALSSPCISVPVFTPPISRTTQREPCEIEPSSPVHRIPWQPASVYQPREMPERSADIRCKEEAVEEQVAHELEWRRQLARFNERGIPTKDAPRILADELQDTEAVRAACYFYNNPDARLLVISGPSGCGKTTAGAWLISTDSLDEYVQFGSDFDYEREDEAGRLLALWSPEHLHPRYVTASELARVCLHDEETMGILARCSMLCIDDLGVEYDDSRGLFSSRLDGLIDSRYAADLRTCITTSLTRSAFRDRVGVRIARRIQEVGVFVGIDESKVLVHRDVATDEVERPWDSTPLVAASQPVEKKVAVGR